MKFKYYRRYKRKRFSKLQKLQVAKKACYFQC